MNVITILSLFLACSCVENGRATSPGECNTAVSTSLPDAKSGCCGVNPPLSKLLNGFPKKSDIDQFRWLALIEYLRTKNNELVTPCGGALISSQYVLTAAHCVSGTVLNIVGTPVNIRLGEYNKTHDGPDCVPNLNGGKSCTEGDTRIAIEQIINHPDYNHSHSQRNDVALIRMAKPAPYTDFIHPICLPTMDVTVSKEQVHFTLASWGNTYRQDAIKQYLELPFVTQATCNQIYSSKHLSLWKGQLCAGGQKDQDACRGEAGMPLTYDNGGSYEIIGIVSFGFHPCGQENAPSVYTNVYEYKSWITSNILP